MQQDPLKGEDRSPTVDGHIFMSVRLSDEFVGDPGVRGALGWYSENEYLVETGRSDAPITTLFFPIQSAAGKAGILKNLTLTIISLSPKKGIYPYGERYNLVLTVNGSLNLQSVADALYSTTFNVGPGRNTSYTVLPNSIKEKRAKKTSTTF